MENHQTPHPEQADQADNVEHTGHATHQEHHAHNASLQKTVNGKGNGRQILMGILAYLSVFIVIPYAFAKNDPFVKFHIKQGLVLISINVIIWALNNIFWELRPLIGLLNILVFILVIIGIINVAKKKQKELPLVGSFAKYFNNI